MSKTTYQPTKLFTPEEANACLPLVRVIAADMVELAGELAERRRRLRVLTEGRELGEGDLYSDELADIERELSKSDTRLGEYVDELSELGVEPKSALEGLIDFPAMMEGRLVFLCWKFNESAVTHWHELEAGFSGRQRLELESMTPG